MNDDLWPREKKWSDLYLRSEKLHRAKQLGMEYPRVQGHHQIEQHAVNVLFICSKNRWRSPTAEKMYADHDLFRVRSAGTSRSANRVVRSGDLKWADVVIAMEPKHVSRLRADFPGETRYLDIHCADIPDDYRFMDPELQGLIADAVTRILPDHANGG
ncbi:low molecular weight protein tyrosine phosphatase family protein [Rubripirellula reticaptiva]|uniref:Low molecular weight phosphotyrosine protein phosphatase n=1 Tax=Rubripirellula reticaptiva TaxID=2528013 RepID=A0A5C6EBK2_9BACT|nr:hypothetical protein [Rubripirellula reticaptiva]TWU44559.1 Low molecular weight phosphotyrosine protein phosphatase [Rubripirellula reticaptiva]